MYKFNKINIGVIAAILMFIFTTVIFHLKNIENNTDFSIGMIFFIGWWTLNAGYGIGGCYGILQKIHNFNLN